MTTLAAIQTWGSLGPSAFVLLSDSRLTDLARVPPNVICDCYQKTFYSRSAPYVVAFCGDKQPAKAAIDQSLSTLIDWHSPAPALLLEELGSVIERAMKLRATKYRVQIVHATCDTLKRKFLAEEISFDPVSHTTIRRPINIGPKQVTENLAGLGTGFNQYAALREVDHDQPQIRKRSGPLSAAEHVHKFSQFVASGKDPSTGGLNRAGFAGGHFL